jgi:hypothetical protein
MWNVDEDFLWRWNLVNDQRHDDDNDNDDDDDDDDDVRRVGRDGLQHRLGQHQPLQTKL